MHTTLETVDLRCDPDRLSGVLLVKLLDDTRAEMTVLSEAGKDVERHLDLLDRIAQAFDLRRSWLRDEGLEPTVENILKTYGRPYGFPAGGYPYPGEAALARAAKAQ